MTEPLPDVPRDVVVTLRSGMMTSSKIITRVHCDGVGATLRVCLDGAFWCIVHSAAARPL